MGAVFMADHVYDVIAAGRRRGRRPRLYLFRPSGQRAVALEVLKLYEGGLLGKRHKAGARLLAGLESLRDHPLVGDVRGRGMLMASNS